MKQQGKDFDIVYEQYADMLYRLAISYLGNCQDAQDVLQEVFIRYLHKSIAFYHDDHLRAWLVRVTINKCHDVLRSRKHHLSIDEISEPAFTPTTSVLFDQIAVLPEKLKSVVILHYLEGYAIEEVASMLHLSISAVKMRLLRARKILKKDRSGE